MPFDKVMPKFKAGLLRSGSKNGPPVKNKKQALAIMLSEKLQADDKPEYKSKNKHNIGPSKKLKSKFNV